LSFRGHPRNLINNKIKKIRFLIFVRNDKNSYYDTASLGERVKVRGKIITGAAMVPFTTPYFSAMVVHPVSFG